MSMVLPILLAAFRDEDIGADITVYVISSFEMVQKMDSVQQAVIDIQLEPLYVIVIYISSLITDKLWLALLLTEALIIIPSFSCFIKLRKYVPPVFALFVFYCIFYNHSLNLMRQSVALALILLAVAYMINGKKTQTAILLLLAVGFHTSAILGWTLPVIYFFSRHYPLYSHKLMYILGSIIALVISFSMSTILIKLISMGVLDAKYIMYAETGVFEARVSKSTMVMKIMELGILTIAIYSAGRRSPFLSFFFICGIINVMFGMTGAIVVYLSRISWFFEIVSFISIPYCFSKVKIIPNRKFLQLLLIITLCFYWWFAFVYSGETDTIPYTSKILNISK